MNTVDPYRYESGYILLPVTFPQNLPDTLIHEGNLYHLKTELHISLVCVKRIVEIAQNALKTEQIVLDIFNKYVESIPLTSFTLGAEIRHVSKDIRESLVVMTPVDGVAGLFESLRSATELDFPNQPTHITLYTTQPNRGISISSDAELGAISEPVIVHGLGRAY